MPKEKTAAQKENSAVKTINRQIMNLTASRKKPTAVLKRSPHAAPDTLRSLRLTLPLPCLLNTIYSLHRCNTLYSLYRLNAGFSLYRPTHCNSALRCNALLRVRNNIFRFARAISPHQKRLFPFSFPRVLSRFVSYPAGQRCRPHFRQPLSRARYAFLPFRPPQP